MAQAAISHFSQKKLFFVAYVTSLKFYPDHRAPDAFAKFTWTECNIYLDNTRANLPFPKKRELERTRTQFWPWCTPALFLCRESDVTMRVRYLWPNVSPGVLRGFSSVAERKLCTRVQGLAKKITLGLKPTISARFGSLHWYPCMVIVIGNM